MEKRVITAVIEANEPLLETLDSALYIDQYINYDNSNDDDIELIKKMCVAARELAEKYTNMSLAEQVVQVYFSNEEIADEDNRVQLPYGPFSAMTDGYPKSKDNEGTLTAMTLNTGYYLYGDQFKEVYIAKTSTTVGFDTSGLDYIFRFTAGYGITDSTETLPEPIRVAMAKQVAEWWDNRGNYYPILSDRIKELLYPYRKLAWFS